MNEIDKKAFSDAAKDWATKSAGKDLGEYFWQAALAHRDAQPAQVQQEVVHWRAVLTNGGKGEDLPVPKVMGFTDESMAKNKISEMKDFKGWDYRLEALYTTPPAAQGQQEAWAKMNSAPKDGTAILCMLPDGEVPHACRFVNGGWQIVWDGHRLSESDQPIGWKAIDTYTTPPAAPDVAELVEAKEPLYYLQDTRSTVGNCPLWWRENGKGYTTDLREAGKYTFDEAIRQHRCRETDLPWPCEQINAIQRITVDVQYMGSYAKQRAALAKHGGV